MARIYPRLKLQKIRRHAKKPNIFVRLKRKWIGDTYAKIPEDCRSLVKLSDYIKAKSIEAANILDSAKVETPVPKVFPSEEQKFLSSPHDYYDFPSIYITEISNALIYGGTNFVFTQDAVLHHDFYDFDRDYTCEELNNRHLINIEKKNIRLLCRDDRPKLIPAGAVFVDSCARNYAHWLTEVLPRVAIFCAQKEFADVPIIINDGLHKNVMESLAFIVGNKRKIFLLPISRAASVRRLYVTSPSGYVPFEFREQINTPVAQGVFNPHAMRLMIGNLRANIVQKKNAFSEKIYIRRNSKGKRALNLLEVEGFLLEQGFTFIEPEKLSFAEQVILFTNAKIIVGSSGAGMANLMFCSPAAHVIILIGKSQRLSYWYWQNIACTVNCTISYVLGTIPETDRNSHQPNFTVPLDALAEAINNKTASNTKDSE
jgi:capsular polysaccharide biosynthesis protein